MKTITVFTPTFNRAYCLDRVYNSLCRQTSNDFLWLVIDDGSTDDTKQLVNKWIEDKTIEVQYIYQNNQGMHGGYNTAYENIETELNVCMDSDDYFTDDAIEKIIIHWKTFGNENYAGLVGLDATEDGKVIGKNFPADLKNSTLEDLYYKHKIDGDKKLVYRTEIVKKYPKYPLHEGESFVPLGVLYLLIDKEYELLCLNEVLCIVEYMADGSTKNIFKQYKRHPRGFRYSRVIEMNHSNYSKVRWKAKIHYILNCLQLKEYNIFKNNKFPFTTLLALPFGILLYLYLRYKNAK
jgi:glycosyltransferase involved in cell wall biosynthesis